MQGLQLSDHATSVDNMVCMRFASKVGQQPMSGLWFCTGRAQPWSGTCEQWRNHEQILLKHCKIVASLAERAGGIEALCSNTVWILGSHSDSHGSLGQCELWSQVSHFFGKRKHGSSWTPWWMDHDQCIVNLASHRTAHFSWPLPSCQQRNWNLLRSERMRTMSQGLGAHWSCGQICFLLDTSRFWPICNNRGASRFNTFNRFIDS